MWYAFTLQCKVTDLPVNLVALARSIYRGLPPKGWVEGVHLNEVTLTPGKVTCREEGATMEVQGAIGIRTDPEVLKGAAAISGVPDVLPEMEALFSRMQAVGELTGFSKPQKTFA